MRKLALSAHPSGITPQSFAPRCYQIFNIGMRIMGPTNAKNKVFRCFATIDCL
jgi:hypothetical protein